MNAPRSSAHAPVVRVFNATILSNLTLGAWLDALLPLTLEQWRAVRALTEIDEWEWDRLLSLAYSIKDDAAPDAVIAALDAYNAVIEKNRRSAA